MSGLFSCCMEIIPDDRFQCEGPELSVVGQFDNHPWPESHLRLSSLARFWRGGSAFCAHRKTADPQSALKC
jgi:hypothetical protein